MHHLVFYLDFFTTFQVLLDRGMVLEILEVFLVDDVVQVVRELDWSRRVEVWVCIRLHVFVRLGILRLLGRLIRKLGVGAECLFLNQLLVHVRVVLLLLNLLLLLV